MSEQTQAVMWYAVKKYLDGELNDDRWQYTVDENEANTFFHGYQVIDGEVLNIDGVDNWTWYMESCEPTMKERYGRYLDFDEAALIELKKYERVID